MASSVARIYANQIWLGNYSYATAPANRKPDILYWMQKDVRDGRSGCTAALYEELTGEPFPVT